MSQLRKALAGTLALVLGAAIAPLTLAQAQDRPEAPEAQGSPTMVVLDNSGSMNDNDAGGQTRIDAAKDAATTLIDDLAENTDLGLTYYGGNTSDDRSDYEQGCRDVTVVRGPERGNAAELTNAIAGLEPDGFTPIGKALTDTADELPDGGTIVLVSDGLANCTPPDVCDVAEDLADSGIDLVINTIGFNVEKDAREELECIADAGNGIYADATDADSLTDALKRATTRQYVAYQSEADEINGSEDRYNTPEIPRDVTTFQTQTPPAADSGTNQSDESSIFWRIPVEQGERLTFALTSVFEPNLESIGEGRLHYTLKLHRDIESRQTGGSSGRCASDSQTLDTNTFHGLQSAYVMSTEVGTDRCDTDEMILELVRRGDYRDGEDITNEITINRFGQVDASTTTAAAEENEVGFPDAVSLDPAAITPGSWFDDAAELDPEGQKITTNIVPGETHFYKIPVGYGQMLQGAIRTTSNQIEERDVVAISDALYLNAYNPSRMAVSLTNHRPGARASEDFEGFAHHGQISYGNMFDTQRPSGYLRSNWQGGDQYLAVTYSPYWNQGALSVDEQLLTVEYELAVNALGDEVDPPVFAAIAGGTTETATEETEETTEPAPETTEVDPADAADAAASNDDNAISLLGLVLSGLALLALISVLVIVVVNRRRSAAKRGN